MNEHQRLALAGRRAKVAGGACGPNMYGSDANMDASFPTGRTIEYGEAGTVAGRASAIGGTAKVGFPFPSHPSPGIALLTLISTANSRPCRSDIRDALHPIWKDKAETARKAINRLGLVMKHGAAMGLAVDLQATMQSAERIADDQCGASGAGWRKRTRRSPTHHAIVPETLSQHAPILRGCLAIRGRNRQIRRSSLPYRPSCPVWDARPSARCLATMA